MNLIDRRPDAYGVSVGGKSLTNKQRFKSRLTAQIEAKAKEAFKTHTIGDTGDKVVVIPTINEPRLHRAATGGQREIVLPGNKKYLAGDKIPKPKQASGKAGGSNASEDAADTVDGYRFVLSFEEWLKLVFKDFALPNMKQQSVALDVEYETKRMGIGRYGNPSNLDYQRTAKLATGRRLALHRPKFTELEAAQNEVCRLEQTEPVDEAALQQAQETLDTIQRRRGIPFFDQIDIRYRRFEEQPKPVHRAVMFCLMDVSASMNEEMKQRAKLFFTLLHLFLTKRYKHVAIEFISHTNEAAVVDQQEFFHGSKSGSTIVSSALIEMRRVIEAKYKNGWNVYGAQASDGDNISTDAKQAAAALGELLKLTQYFVYVEVPQLNRASSIAAKLTDLWTTYAPFQAKHSHFVMKSIKEEKDILPVFGELFGPARNTTAQRPAAFAPAP